MKRRLLFSTAVALGFSAASLFAQDATPPAPPTPAASPTPPAAPAPPQQGALGAGGHRPMGGLFDALDTNHDGVIDQDELAKAADVLRKLDKNGDGKITPDEFHPPGAGPRPGMRGPREGGAQQPAPSQGPETARDGTRGGPMHHHGFRGEGRMNAAEGFRGGQGPHEMRRPESDGQRGGGDFRGTPPAPGEGPQAMHRGPGGGPGEGRFARHEGGREMQPDANREMMREAFERGVRRGEEMARRRMEFSSRMDERGGPGMARGHEDRERPQLRDELGFRGPQNGPGEFHPGREGDRQQPAHTQRPGFESPQDGPRGPGEFHRPEMPRDGDHQSGPPRPPMDRRGPFPPGPRDFQ